VRRRIGLVDADDSNVAHVAVRRRGTDIRAEADLRAIGRRRRHHRAGDSLLQLGPPRRARLGVDGRRPRRGSRVERGQLVAQRLETARRHVVRYARRQRRAPPRDRRLGGTVVLGEGLGHAPIMDARGADGVAPRPVSPPISCA